jgi:hypothetical protein
MPVQPEHERAPSVTWDSGSFQQDFVVNNTNSGNTMGPLTKATTTTGTVRIFS